MRFPATVAIAAAFAGFSMPAGAAPFTVTWGAQSVGGALATSDGKELPPGCLVRLGVFDLPLDRVRDLAWDLTALEGHFTELARSAIGQFDEQSSSLSGAFAQSTSLDLAAALFFPQRGTACVCAYNAANPAAATQIGIFSSPSWVLTGTQFGVATWDLSQVRAETLCAGSLGTSRSTTLGGEVLQLASLTVLADASDADGDGVVQLLEEAFGMNRQSADSALLPAAVVVDSAGAARPGFRFRRRADGQSLNAAVYESAGLRYTIEVSDDLNQWVVGSQTCELLSSVPLDGGYELVTVGESGSTPGPLQFFRLKVERL